MGKSNLVNYGIYNEQSDIRAHVAPQCRRVFVYQTRAMLNLLEYHKYPQTGASQEAVDGITGWGYLIPIEAIPDLRILRPAEYRWHDFPRRTASTSEKGAAAMRLIKDILSLGHFPLWVNAYENKQRDVQISGTDILICCRQRIQVKCDWRAGRREWGGSGNLFIQTAERNPRGMI